MLPIPNMTPNQWFQIHNPQVLFFQLQIQPANELYTPKIPFKKTTAFTSGKNGPLKNGGRGSQNFQLSEMSQKKSPTKKSPPGGALIVGPGFGFALHLRPRPWMRMLGQPVSTGLKPSMIHSKPNKFEVRYQPGVL